MPALPATVVNCSGAGDCLVAGCLFGLVLGLPAEAALAHGVAAATAAVGSQANVPPGLQAAAVRQGAAAVQARSSTLHLPLHKCC
jgi:fructose-1-phosphate kinase PfkB-like protein